MIRVFRTDGTELLLNADLIRTVEGSEPTVIVLVNGERIEVKNPAIDIQVKIYARRFGMEEEERNRPDPDEIDYGNDESTT